MYLDSIRIPAFEAINRRLASVRRAVVSHPKDSTRRSIRFLSHDKINQMVEIGNSGAITTQTKDLSPSDIPSRHVGQGSFSFIFMLYTTIASNCRSGCGYQSVAGLNTGFFIRRKNKIMGIKRFFIPNTLIQVQNFCSLLFKFRITRPNPTSVTPGSNCVFVQPTPDSFSANRGDNPPLFDFSCDFIMCKLGERQPKLFWQLTGKSFNSNNDFRGKKRRVFPAVAFPEVRPRVGQKNVFAIWRQFVGANQDVGRFLYLKVLLQQGE